MWLLCALWSVITAGVFIIITAVADQTHFICPPADKSLLMIVSRLLLIEAKIVSVHKYGAREIARNETKLCTRRDMASTPSGQVAAAAAL